MSILIVDYFNFIKVVSLFLPPSIDLLFCFVMIIQTFFWFLGNSDMQIGKLVIVYMRQSFTKIRSRIDVTPHYWPLECCFEWLFQKKRSQNNNKCWEQPVPCRRNLSIVCPILLLLLLLSNFLTNHWLQPKISIKIGDVWWSLNAKTETKAILFIINFLR